MYTDKQIQQNYCDTFQLDLKTEYLYNNIETLLIMIINQVSRINHVIKVFQRQKIVTSLKSHSMLSTMIIRSRIKLFSVSKPWKTSPRVNFTCRPIYIIKLLPVSTLRRVASMQQLT